MELKRSKMALHAIAVALLLVAPDLVYAVVCHSFQHTGTFRVSHDPKVLLLIIPLGIGLITARPKALSFTYLAFLCLIQLGQFAHIAYFGTCASAHSVYMLLYELGDVIRESANVFWQYAYIIPVVVTPFVGIAYLIRSSERCRLHLVGTILLIGTICAIGTRVPNRHRGAACCPNEIRFTINNSLKVLWGYLLVMQSNMVSIKKYIPYEVIDTGYKPDAPVTIVYIIGESMNYNHMSLFGYERDTTPNLKRLATEQTFYHTPGIAGGIVTLSSCKFMMNIVREADNSFFKCANMTNLFKFAKSRGFKTFYLSAQTEHLLTSIAGVHYIDVLITKDSNIAKARSMQEDYLRYLLDQQTFTDRNFIVLHQWCIHSPYNDFPNIKKFSGSAEARVDEYDSAMTYNDVMITRLFERFNKQKRGKFYIIFASDHNELLGEDGLYGHSHLAPKVADIPVMIQSNDKAFMDEMRAIFKPNHFEIATVIAKLLGYEIRNPNEEPDTFYISGAEYSGKFGYIKYRKSSKDRIVEYLLF
ncbi:MAG: sulfatase-like hydrolase/transferase [Holosporales bacterium]|jgi:glucan phosphoethanolaminetransferase (alkaline phosphatase superfamily)|nr:sulfatase-like hydrolase/transferase [Holosporales bacterium]